MATAKKLPSGNWRVRVYVGNDASGKHIYKSITAESKKEAERQAAMYEYEAEKKAASGMTVGEAMDAYIQNNSNVLSPVSTYKYSTLRKSNYYKDIEDTPVKSIKQSDIQQFVNTLSKKYKPRTVASIYSLLYCSIRAVDDSVVFRVNNPKIRQTDIVIPTDEEIKQLIANVRSEEMKCAILLGASLGLRRSEISALTWGDIDGDILRVNKAMVRQGAGVWVVKSTKSKAGDRALELPPYVKEKLLSQKKDGAKETDHIIQIDPDTITRRFMFVRDSLGIKCRFHDLRHYNASVMLALGVPDKYAMQRMGHSSTNMLRNVYQHIISEKEKEVTQRVNQYMNRLNSP